MVSGIIMGFYVAEASQAPVHVIVMTSPRAGQGFFSPYHGWGGQISKKAPEIPTCWCRCPV